MKIYLELFYSYVYLYVWSYLLVVKFGYYVCLRCVPLVRGIDAVCSVVVVVVVDSLFKSYL